MKPQRIFVIFVIAFLGGFTSSAVNAQPKSILLLADQYSSALTKYQSQNNRSSVEPLLRKGNLVAEKLDEMEDLSASDYARLEKSMKGFVVNRDEVVFVQPDVKFFSDLSRKHGTAADIAFFDLLKKIRPDSVWAAYIEQQTDYSGCTIYGDGSLTKLYGRALQFRKSYPKAFVIEIKREINDILEAFSVSSCACGKIEGVLKEFRLFIKTFPKDKNTPEIKKNLVKIKKRGDFRFNCHSG